MSTMSLEELDRLHVAEGCCGEVKPVVGGFKCLLLMEE